MADHASTAVDISSITPNTRSRWSVLLPIVWGALGARVAIAMVRGESIREDFLSLALVAFLMTSAVLGSRVWLWFHDHWEHLTFRHRATDESAMRS